MSKLNVELVNKLADAIEDSYVNASPEKWGFNMAHWQAKDRFRHHDGKPHCGTTACICGWLAHMENEDPFDFSRYGRRKLGLSYDQANALFGRISWHGRDVHPLHAVETLRLLAKTGVIDWAAGWNNLKLRRAREAKEALLPQRILAGKEEVVNLIGEEQGN